MIGSNRHRSACVRGPLRGLSALLPAVLSLGFALAPARADCAAVVVEKLVLVSVDGFDARPEGREALPALSGFLATGHERSLRSPHDAFPSWVELLAGADGTRTGVRDEISGGWSSGGRSLATALMRSGVRTLALPADPLAHSQSGLAQGFERYATVSPALEAVERADSALAWLERPGKAFVWLAFSTGATTDPWRRADGVGPAEDDRRAARLAEIDRALAHLFAAIRERAPGDRPSVVLVGCGRPAVRESGETLVPFAADFAGAAVAPARLADVAGEIARAMGATLPPAARARASVARADSLALPACGSDLARRLLDASVPMPDSVRMAGWDSLAARCGGRRIALERDLAWSRAGREVPAARGLKAAALALRDDPRPALAYADHLLRHGRPELVADALSHVDARDPFAALALWRVSLAEATTLDFAAASRTASRAAALAVTTPAARRWPARLAAIAVIADSVGARPDDGALRLRFGRALQDAELFVPAYTQFHAARGLLAGSAAPDVALAECLLSQGRAQHAWATVRRALELAPEDPGAQALASDVLLVLGRTGEARAQLETLARAPRMEPRLAYNLACLRASAGDTAAALSALERAVDGGYADFDRIENDPDLTVLRGEVRFRALLDRRPRDRR